MGTRRARSVVLDTGALIAFERKDREVVRMLEVALEGNASVHVPAGAVAQIWRDGRGQVRLARLVNSDEVGVRELDLNEAKAAGALCGLTGTADVVDASVVLLARRHRAVVVTSDPDDIRRVDPSIEIRRC